MDIDANLIIGIITGSFVFFVIERRYRPSMKVELATSWLDKDKGLLKIHIGLTNQKKKLVKFKSAKLQYLEHPCPIEHTISEFVPFTYKDYKEMYVDKKGNLKHGAPGWHDPDDVLMKSKNGETKKLEPQEIVSVERRVIIRSCV